MENFDRENNDELLEIRQIRQYFPPLKFCAVQYMSLMYTVNIYMVVIYILTNVHLSTFSLVS